MPRGVSKTAELLRILDLPRRSLIEKDEELVFLLSDAYSAPQGEMTLRPIQALALSEFHDNGGLLGSMPVGSGKTLVEGDHGLINMHDLGRNMMCIREFQSSVADSVHAVLNSEIKRLELDNSDVTERTVKFTHNNAMARFMGLSRNPESVKSAFGFLDWWVEEAQFLSEK